MNNKRTFKTIEKYIQEYTNINTGKSKYRVLIVIKGKTYTKTYFDLECARIFKRTILNNIKND